MMSNLSSVGCRTFAANKFLSSLFRVCFEERGGVSVTHFHHQRFIVPMCVAAGTANCKIWIWREHPNRCSAVRKHITCFPVNDCYAVYARLRQQLCDFLIRNSV